MSVIHPPDHKPSLTRVFEGLTEPRRRDIIAAIDDTAIPMTEAELARSIADANESATASDPDRIQATLRHSHLPKLADLDLVKWDRAAATVAPGDHPIRKDPRFRKLLTATDERWTATTTVHSNAGRRATAAVLLGATGPTTRSDLAETLADSEAETLSESPEEVAVTLHHFHLPKLAEVGLIEYDSDEGTVRPTGDVGLPIFDGIYRVD